MTDLPERLTAAANNSTFFQFGLLQEAAEAIERLTKERDEARSYARVANAATRGKIEVVAGKHDKAIAEKAGRRGFERAREAILCRLDQLAVITPDAKDESVLAYLARVMEILRTGYQKEVRAIPYTTDEGEKT